MSRATRSSFNQDEQRQNDIASVYGRTEGKVCGECTGTLGQFQASRACAEIASGPDVAVYYRACGRFSARVKSPQTVQSEREVHSR